MEEANPTGGNGRIKVFMTPTGEGVLPGEILWVGGVPERFEGKESGWVDAGDCIAMVINCVVDGVIGEVGKDEGVVENTEGVAVKVGVARIVVGVVGMVGGPEEFVVGVGGIVED